MNDAAAATTSSIPQGSCPAVKKKKKNHKSTTRDPQGLLSTGKEITLLFFVWIAAEMHLICIDLLDHLSLLPDLFGGADLATGGTTAHEGKLILF